MKKFFPYSLMFVLILVIALSGCGGGKNGGPSGGPSDGPSDGPNDGPGGVTTYTPGQQSPAYKVDGVTFYMRYAPSGSFTSDDAIISHMPDLPTTITVNKPFWIAETEVTYELWSVVYKWATGDINMNGIIDDDDETAGTYTFAHVGVMGDGDDINTATDKYPVTTVSWRDAMVWCNALTEYYYRDSDNCVYYKDAAYTTPIRTSTNVAVDTAPGTQDNPYVKAGFKGFRLPTSDEWELVARYHFKEGIQWLPGDHVSGDATGYCYDSGISTTRSDIFKKYAWYNGNSDHSTHPVATTELKNALNLSDLSGNVLEWCFDWHPEFIGLNRMIRGGGYIYSPRDLQIGFSGSGRPTTIINSLGFRPVRTQ